MAEEQMNSYLLTSMEEPGDERMAQIMREVAFRKGKPSLQVLRFDRNFSQAIKSQQWISANSLQINLLSS